MSYGYKLNLVIGSNVEIPDEVLMEMGVEIHQSVISFLKAKRIPAKLVGEFDITGGIVND